MCACSDAATQPAVLGRVVAQYRRAQPHQLQHALRLQDAHDYLSRHRPRRSHALAMGHLQLDPASLRRVGFQQQQHHACMDTLRAVVQAGA